MFYIVAKGTGLIVTDGPQHEGIQVQIDLMAN
jgi:hypothetical protein